jgi:hypothetical protein
MLPTGSLLLIDATWTGGADQPSLVPWTAARELLGSGFMIVKFQAMTIEVAFTTCRRHETLSAIA